MVHGDDKGLVLPPRVAPTQAVIIYIYNSKTSEEDIQRLRDKVFLSRGNDMQSVELRDQLKAAGIRVELDTREHYNPGWKYNYWEQKGIPLRIEMGPKDLEKEQVVFARRDDLSPSGKTTVAWKDVVPAAGEMVSVSIGSNQQLETIQASMLDKARRERDSHIRYVSNWEEFVKALDGNMVLAPWCECISCEEEVKKRTAPDATEKKPVGEAPALSGSAKTLCLPFNQEQLPEDCKCFCCGQKATAFALWGRSY